MIVGRSAKKGSKIAEEPVPPPFDHPTSSFHPSAPEIIAKPSVQEQPESKLITPPNAHSDFMSRRLTKLGPLDLGVRSLYEVV